MLYYFGVISTLKMEAAACPETLVLCTTMPGVTSEGPRLRGVLVAVIRSLRLDRYVLLC